MTDRKFDVVAIGNAIVDVLAHVDPAFLVDNDIEKSAMTLIDEDRAQALYGRMPPAVEMSGGSAANTVAGLASLGARAAYIGRVKKDQLGEVFAHDLRAIGVVYDTPPALDGPSTARCLIMVTPDAHRSMNTYLGASAGLSRKELDLDLIRQAKITYLEGYLFDRPEAKDAFYLAAKTAAEAGNKVSLTLSDKFCVDRHRADFVDLISGYIDILFANEEEAKALFETEDFDEAIDRLREVCELAAVTRSEKGSIIQSAHDFVEVGAEPVDRLEDTTGAGDQYAAGFLYGYTQGKDLLTCGRLGSLAAAEVISHFGARPEVSLKQLAAGQRIL